jgi:ribosome-binding factor A
MQHELSRKLTTRRCPKLKFFQDVSFETAGRVGQLIEENRTSFPDPVEPDEETEN